MISDNATWVRSYLARQCNLLAMLPTDSIGQLIEIIRETGENGRNIFVIGNGGNAANASHFATDLGKGASDCGPRRFRVLSLTDNVSWLTALGNVYAQEDVFVRQLMNFAQPGDVLIASSVSGNSPNLVKAAAWARANGLEIIALVGGKRGELAKIATRVIVVEDTHYGRVEDVQMTVLHLLCYSLMESGPTKANSSSALSSPEELSLVKSVNP
jgi:D-sedoheptulose 7-phosphate isomerase